MGLKSQHLSIGGEATIMTHLPTAARFETSLAILSFRTATGNAKIIDVREMCV